MTQSKPTPAALEGLARRAEAALSTERAEVLSDIWDALGPVECWTPEQAGRFGHLINAGAFTDAAVMLVPRGWQWLRKDFSTMTCVQLTGTDRAWAKHIDGAGLGPAMALAAASCRARAASEEAGRG